jgi:hypothetical protein
MLNSRVLDSVPMNRVSGKHAAGLAGGKELGRWGGLASYAVSRTFLYCRPI